MHPFGNIDEKMNHIQHKDANPACKPRLWNEAWKDGAEQSSKGRV